MLVTFQKRSVSPADRRARTTTVSALVQWGIRWVGTGLAPGGFQGWPAYSETVCAGMWMHADRGDIQEYDDSSWPKTSEAAQDGSEADGPAGPRVCIVGASGKLGRYMVRHALDRGYDVVAVCREVSVDKLEEFSAYHDHSGCDGRPPCHRAGGRGLRWRPRRVGSRGSTTTRQEQPRRCSTWPVPGLAWCSRVGTTSRAMARTCTRGRSRRSSMWWAGLRDSSAWSTSTIRWRRAGGSCQRHPVDRGTR